MAKCVCSCGCACEVGEARSCEMCCDKARADREAKHAKSALAPLPEPPPFVAPEVTCEGDHRGDCSLPPDHDGRCQLFVSEPEPPAPAPTSRRGKRRGA